MVYLLICWWAFTLPPFLCFCNPAINMRISVFSKSLLPFLWICTHKWNFWTLCWFVFNVLEIFHTVFHELALLYIPSNGIQGSFHSKSLPLVIFCLFVHLCLHNSWPSRYEMIFIVALISIAIVMSVFVYLYKYLLIIYICFAENSP